MTRSLPDLRVPESTAPDRAPSSAAEPPVPVVTIPQAEYAALLAAKKRMDAIDARERRYPIPPRSPVQADIEIAEFFRERFGKMRMEDILMDCTRRFGTARTPSRTAAYDYWKRLREGRPK